MPLYRYSTFGDPADAGAVYRPLISATLINGNNDLNCLCLVDTGADYCSFPMSYAISLGLSPLGRQPATILGVGSGGAADAYLFDLVLHVDSLGEFRIRAAFMESLNVAGLGLLGHQGFLDSLKAAFRTKWRVFELELEESTD